jgi:hypothetical protein
MQSQNLDEDSDEIITIDEDFITPTHLIRNQLDCTNGFLELMFPEEGAFRVIDPIILMIGLVVHLVLFVTYLVGILS